jgi:hypothetical protein
MTQTQNTEQSLEHYFKLGQDDYAQGFHEPFGGITSYLGLTTDKEQEINEAYRKGWNSARSQNAFSSQDYHHTTIIM